MSNPKLIPPPTRVNGLLFFDRHGFENYKRALQGLPPLDRDPRAPIELVPANRAAKELGCHRRSLGRKVAEREAAAKQALVTQGRPRPRDRFPLDPAMSRLEKDSDYSAKPNSRPASARAGRDDAPCDSHGNLTLTRRIQRR